MTLTTTLNRIRDHRPCAEGWTKLLAGLGKTAPDDEPLSYATIARINGIDDALWCCRAEPRYDKHWRLFAVWCARQVEYLMTDQRSRNALDVAERHAHGEATDAELDAAFDAARDAARAAEDAACPAAWSAAWAAVWAAVWDAARDAARVAAWDAAWAAWAAAWAAANDAAWAAEIAAEMAAAKAAARDAAKTAQLAHFIEIAEAGG